MRCSAHKSKDTAMIASSRIAEVQRLLVEGKHSQRKIAQLTGVSRGTIGAIALGQRPDYTANKASRCGAEEPLGPPQRCAGCGGMVYMPCRLCRDRKAQRQRACAANPAAAAQAAEIYERPGLELRADHRVRYEEVRAARRRADDSTVLSTDP
jgi:hypothetical protein